MREAAQILSPLPAISPGVAMRYPGGKGGAGVYQTIINLIPPHRVYVEAFTGGGNIFARKAPAASSILVERDPRVAAYWRDQALPATTVVEGDALAWLAAREWAGDEFVYLDPPYVLSTRTKKAIYAHEMTDEQHLELVTLLATMADRGVRFLLSGYRNDIYDEAAGVNGWRRVDFNAMTRGGVRVESAWMNYDAPSTIADYAYVGSNFRERERIKRKVQRWKQRLQQLPALERAALIAAIQDLAVAAAPAADGDARSPADMTREYCA